MKMIRNGLALLFAVALLMTGCTGPKVPSDPPETVDNLFVNPTTAPTEANGDPTGGTDATSPTEEDVGLGHLSAGYDENTSAVSDREQTLSYAGGEVPIHQGRYVTYEGEELHVGYSFQIMGSMAKKGIGFMLILDGIPQPYRTADQEEYTYLHTFYPPTEKGGIINIEMIFTPVTGQAGDNLLMNSVYLLDPQYDPTKGAEAFRSASFGGNTQLVFTADPPQPEIPAVTERIRQLNIETQDLTSSDIFGWSAEDLQTKYSFEYSVDAGQASDMYFGVTEESGLKFHAEVFSPSMAQWRLILFIDHQPVSVLAENRMDFSVHNGQKAVIDLTLDMSGYRESAPLYAVLVCRNSYDPMMQGLQCGSSVTRSHYLSREADWNVWLDKYRTDASSLEG